MAHGRSSWHRAEGKTWTEVGTALAFTIWKASVKVVDNLSDADFKFSGLQQRFAVLEEVLCFLVQATDRWSHERQLQTEERGQLITSIVNSLAAILEDNQSEWIGPGDYRARFISTFNARAQEYAEMQFSGDDKSGGYAFRRYLGQQVLELMGEGDGNRWVMDQIMDIEVPEAFKTVKRSVQGLLKR